MTRYLPHLVLIVVMLGVGFMNGLLFPADAWYDGLEKPWFNPPDWLFAPVWSVLYVLIGFAGGMVWNWNAKSAAMQLWFAQFILNAVWTPVFFGSHLLAPALAVIILLLITIIYFIIRIRKHLPLAAWLFVPYGAWVAFATLLNAALLSLN